MFLFPILFIAARTHSILINTSKGFMNYRHMSNVQTLRDFLVTAGFKDENILVVAQEDPHDDHRNLIKDKIYFNDAEYIDRRDRKHLPDDVVLSERHILDILGLKHDALKDLNENDNVFFYICGHGREGFIKISDRFFLFRNDLMDALSELSLRVNHAVVILDTCQASTLISEKGLPRNVTVVTTSLQEEFSYSSNIVSFLGVFGVDDFVYTFYRNPVDLNAKIEEALASIQSHVSSTLKVWGNKDIVLSEFFSNKSVPAPLKEFVLQNDSVLPSTYASATPYFNSLDTRSQLLPFCYPFALTNSFHPFLNSEFPSPFMVNTTLFLNAVVYYSLWKELLNYLFEKIYHKQGKPEDNVQQNTYRWNINHSR